MPTIALSRDYRVPATAIWGRIRDFHALHTWLPGIADTRHDDQDPAIRHVVREDGAVVLEKQLAISDDDMSVRYTILAGDVPVRDFEGVITVRDRRDAGSTMTWDVSFSTDADESELTAALTELLTGGLRRLDETA